MQQPSRRFDKRIEPFIQRLPSCWRELMVELKAFTFGRKIKTPQDLLQVILLYCGLDMSLRETAATFTLLHGERITDSSILDRLAKCADFLEALVKEVLQCNALPPIPFGRRVLVGDATAIQGPGAKGTDYRIHLCIELLSLTFEDMQVTDFRGGESLKNFQPRPGDICLFDRGYCSPSDIHDHVQNSEADVILRWNTGVPIYDSAERTQPIDLVEKLQDMKPGETRSFTAFVGHSPNSKVKDERVTKGRLVVFRMHENKAKAAQKKAKKNKSKKQKTVKPETLFLAQFVILFTSVAPELLDQDAVLTLYRFRWQIELVFKRMKSLLKADKLRSKRCGRLAKTYLLGKALYVLMLDAQLRRWLAASDFALDSPKRKISPWRPTKLLRRVLDSAIAQVARWRPEVLDVALGVLMERSRRRVLQTVPERILSFEGFFEPRALDDAA